MAQVQRQMSSHANLDDVTFRDMYQGIEKDSMAYKLLASMGWKEGEGLVSIQLCDLGSCATAELCSRLYMVRMDVGGE